MSTYSYIITNGRKNNRQYFPILSFYSKNVSNILLITRSY